MKDLFSLWLCFVMIVMLDSVRAASFDCSKSDIPPESVICASKSLSELDSLLARTYQSVMSNSPPMFKTALIEDQRRWIKITRNGCRDENCLILAYQDRIKSLKTITLSHKSDNIKAELVVEPDTQRQITLIFQKYLSGTGIMSRLTDCTHMVSLYHTNGGQEESYGAICIFNKHAVEICGDKLVGKFAMNFSFSESNQGVADFAELNCYPGG